MSDGAKASDQTVVYGVDERPPLGQWLPLSLQHLFAMSGATILVALLTGLDPAVVLFTSGVGTLIYMAVTKGGFRPIWAPPLPLSPPSSPAHASPASRARCSARSARGWSIWWSPS